MKGYRDPYKVEQINKILGAADFYAYLSGDHKTSGAKTINLDGEVLELAKGYYEGKKITVEADEDTFAESEDAQWAVTSYWCGESGVTKIWLCSSEEEAINKMQRLWEKSYNFALEDDNFDEERSYHEEHEARVAWDDELYRIFEVVQIAAEGDEEI